MGIEAFGWSERGRNRKVNQDQFVVATLAKRLEITHSSLRGEDIRLPDILRGHLLAVADGAGGMDRGDEASRFVTEVLLGYVHHTMPWFLRLRPDLAGDPKDEWTRAVEACNRALLSYAERSGSKMATTLTLAYVTGRYLYVTQIGDSRCYLVREASIQQLTRDQTMAQQMVDQGTLSEADADLSPLSHVLTSAIGAPERRLVVDHYQVKLDDGDLLMLCTDGLTKVLSDEQILEYLMAKAPLEERCRALVDAGHAPEDSDDAAVVLAAFSADDLPEVALDEDDVPTAQLPAVEPTTRSD